MHLHVVMRLNQFTFQAMNLVSLQQDKNKFKVYTVCFTKVNTSKQLCKIALRDKVKDY